MREYVRGNLARYKVPRDVVFLAELPRNPTGKVLKRELVRSDGRANGPPVADGLRPTRAAPGRRLDPGVARRPAVSPSQTR